MLFALVRGLRPALALEIGARWGGSARIITNAMQENGVGRLIGIDPRPDVFRAKPGDLHRRYTLLEGYSPQAIPAAAQKAGGKFDFIFVDALHIYDAALADFRGCLPHLADGAHVLFHDAYHQGLDQAIGEVLVENSELVDCGIITRNAPPTFPVTGQGLRLIRKGPVDSKKLIREAYERNNETPPPFSRDVWNYDESYNRILSEKQDAAAES
jgi:predicted O-methyltransferase YrrM